MTREPLLVHNGSVDSSIIRLQINPLLPDIII
jgi:hypothetical protein